MAITSLGRLRDRRAVEPLIRVAKVYWNARGPYEPGLAGASALALGEIGDRRAVPALLKLVTTGKRMDNPLVGRAVIALGKIGDSRARGPLSRLFRQAQPRTWQQRSLAVALGLLGDTGAIPVLKEHLKSTFHGDGWPPACPDYEQTEEAAQALARIGRPAFKVLVDALDWRYKHTTDYVCLALGQLHDGRALRPVIRLLEDPSYRTRHHAALALGELGNPKALPYLRRATRDPSGYVRVGAAEALWRVGERTHLSVLVEVLKNDPEDWAREQAGLALGRLADARAIPALHQALQDPYFAVRQAAREALAILSSRRESKAAH
jgi:HEAT repeat protein